MTGALIDVPIDAYRQRAANTPQPRSHKTDAARLLNPKTLNVHDRDMAEWLSDTAVNYFPDISEYQPLFDSSFAYPIRMFRCHSGYRTDAHAAANWADTGKSLANSKTRVAFTYPVFVPGQFATVKRDFINLFGNQTPTNRLVPVIDMESGPGFAGPGNHSTEANDWAAWFADYSGTPIDMVRSHGYANKPDFAACWPSILPVIPKHTAAYNAINPGTFAWQYQGGNPAYPVPAGAPRSYAPFGTYVDGNVIYLPLEQIEAALGITRAPKLGDEDMPHIVYDLSNPGRVGIVFGNTIVHPTSNTTVQAYEAASSVGATPVPANTPVVGVPTADYDLISTALDTTDKYAALLAAIEAVSGVTNGTAGPTTADITAAMGAALTNGTPRPALPTSASTDGDPS